MNAQPVTSATGKYITICKLCQRAVAESSALEIPVIGDPGRRAQKFIPERAQDKDAKFCTPNHRKAYWRYGGLPFDKMKDQLEKSVKKLIREMVRPGALND